MEIEKFENGDCTIFHGDAIKVLNEKIEDSSINLIFADPPYNIGKKFSNFHDKWNSNREYAEWCYKWLDLCIKKLTPNGALYFMTSTEAMPYLDLYIRDKMTVKSRIVWAYDSSGVQAKKHFGSLWEPILFCVKNKNNYIFNSDDILVETKTGAKRKLIDYRGETPKPYNTKKVPGNVWKIVINFGICMKSGRLICQTLLKFPSSFKSTPISFSSSPSTEIVLRPFIAASTIAKLNLYAVIERFPSCVFR